MHMSAQLCAKLSRQHHGWMLKTTLANLLFSRGQPHFLLHMFQFASQTKAHDADVKSIKCAYLCNAGALVVASASRDGRVRIWVKDGRLLTLLAEHAEHAGFVNSVAIVQTDGKDVVASGGIDKLVYLFDIADGQIVGALVGHENNVCHLSSSDGLVISSSWDSTSKVWNGSLEVACLKGHGEAVWCGAVIDSHTFITASADKSLGLWQDGTRICTLLGHTDAVRAVCVLDNSCQDVGEFASVSNDGQLLFWRQNCASPTKAIKAHDAFIYTMACYKNLIATAGEDRQIKIWLINSPDDISCIQTICVPAVSVWCVDFDPNGDIMCACSDGYIYTFSASGDQSNCTADEAAEFKARLAASNITKASTEANDISSIDVLSQPGKSVGQVVLVKPNNSDDATEAHQWDGSCWTKIGTVVDGPSGDQKSRKPYNGVMYDYVFDVEIESGVSLKLPFNDGDNPYVAASNFLAEHNLGIEMQDQIVDFLIKNTQAKVIEQQSSALFNPYLEQDQPSSDEALSPFDKFNSDGICKKLLEFNSIESQTSRLSKECLDNVKRLLTSANLATVPVEVDELLAAAEHWKPEHLFPLFDILRILLIRPNITLAISVFKLLNIRLGDIDQVPAAVITAARLACNAINAVIQSQIPSNLAQDQVMTVAETLFKCCYVLNIKEKAIPATLVGFLCRYAQFAHIKQLPSSLFSTVQTCSLLTLNNADVDATIQALKLIHEFADKQFCLSIAAQLHQLASQTQFSASHRSQFLNLAKRYST